MLRLQNLCKSFGSLVVTDHVTLDITPGEMHAVIGPNGAGKTTLINQISGLITPDDGRILFAGADVTRLPPQARALRGLSRSFQITSILPGFSVLENVALAVQARTGSSLRFYGRAAEEQALNAPALAALEQAGIAGARAGARRRPLPRRKARARTCHRAGDATKAAAARRADGRHRRARRPSAWSTCCGGSRAIRP